MIRKLSSLIKHFSINSLRFDNFFKFSDVRTCLQPLCGRFLWMTPKWDSNLIKLKYIRALFAHSIKASLTRCLLVDPLKYWSSSKSPARATWTLISSLGNIPSLVPVQRLWEHPLSCWGNGYWDTYNKSRRTLILWFHHIWGSKNRMFRTDGIITGSLFTDHSCSPVIPVVMSFLYSCYSCSPVIPVVLLFL